MPRGAQVTPRPHNRLERPKYGWIQLQLYNRSLHMLQHKALYRLRSSHVRESSHFRQRHRAQHQHHDMALFRLTKLETKQFRLLSKKHGDLTSSSPTITDPHLGLRALYLVVYLNVVRINQVSIHKCQ
jgi:hypothetical protein